jgi:hypothetical protein
MRGVYVDFTRRFLWIFTYWERVVDDDPLMGRFWGEPNNFHTVERAKNRIRLLKERDSGPQVKIIEK